MYTSLFQYNITTSATAWESEVTFFRGGLICIEPVTFAHCASPTEYDSTRNDNTEYDNTEYDNTECDNTECDNTECDSKYQK